jgi:hypothetical protein
VLGVAPSTIHRLLNDGIIAGEKLTPGVKSARLHTARAIVASAADRADYFLTFKPSRTKSPIGAIHNLLSA